MYNFEHSLRFIANFSVFSREFVLNCLRLGRRNNTFSNCLRAIFAVEMRTEQIRKVTPNEHESHLTSSVNQKGIVRKRNQKELHKSDIKRKWIKIKSIEIEQKWNEKELKHEIKRNWIKMKSKGIK